jgi:hemolysin-activating ACP:hemolysin acyltransferase
MRKDGKSIIYFQYCYSHEKHPLLNTQIAIPPSDWNKKKLQVKDIIAPANGTANELNAELKRQFRLLEDLIELVRIFFKICKQ